MLDVLGARLVPPRDRKSIRKKTYSIRQKFGLEDEFYFPIMLFLENLMPTVFPEFYVQVVEDAELPGRMAETIPELHVIRVKKSVYDAACAGGAWAREVMAHELGHYIYHSPVNVVYARLAPGEQVPKDYLPEYQAEVFKAELLMPVNLIRGMNPHAISQKCGVTVGGAKGQLRQAAHTKGGKKKKKRPSKKPDR